MSLFIYILNDTSFTFIERKDLCLKFFASLCLSICSFSSFAINAPVVLISIDGFAADYLDQHQPKTLVNLSQSGLVAEGLIPVFPSKTFPNHLAMVTGKYPSEHGIIHNNFYRRDIDKVYRLGAGKDDVSWLKAEPIWVTAEKNGLKSASYFWPESEANFDNVKPSYRFSYKHNTPNKERLDQVVKWLQLPSEQKPQFITTYFSVVDSAGHDFGTQAKETITAIHNIDQLLAEFLQTLKVNNIEINLVLVSDHGMLDINTEHAINIENIGLSSQLNKVVNGQTQLFIYEDDPILIKETVQTLKAHTNKYQVYESGTFPEHWQLNKRDERIPDILVSTNAPFTFATRHKHTKGTHGFDPKYVPEMDGIFIAQGPDIKKGQLKRFQNRYVHAFLSQLLGLPETQLSKTSPLRLFVDKQERDK